ncbi:MAG: toprim domain-containing protein [Prochloraceae cyanobacterium]|nr:toprim domain-containing protein [Prochloraceae cyanobacterium]
MMIKFFARGTGGGKGPVDYITKERDSQNQLRVPPPEVLRGDPQQTKDLIDSLDFKHKYTSGVISFAPEDAPTEAQQQALMDDFEKLAFAGLQPDQYDILWVRHTHTSNGRVELHFVTPRVELTTQKSLNIAPPGWQDYFDPIRDRWNYSQGWARPDDPERARTLQPGYEALIEAQNKRLNLTDREPAKRIITDYLETKISRGLIENRQDIIETLKEIDLEIPRAGKNYITVLDKESGKRLRLKGAIYDQDWRLGKTLESQNIGNRERNNRYREEKLRELRETIRKNYTKRLEHNAERYRSPSETIEAVFQLDESRDPSRYSNSQKRDRQVVADSNDLMLRSPNRFLRRGLGMDELSSIPDTRTQANSNRSTQASRSPTTEDLGREPDENRQRQIRNPPREPSPKNRMDLFGSTLHQARGLADDRTRADLEQCLEPVSYSVQRGHGAARRTERETSRTEQESTAASQRLEQANQLIDQSNRAVNQRLRQLREDFERAKRVKEEQLKEELERFKTQINLVEYARAQGYEYDKRRSTRSNAALFHNNGDKVVITTDRDGHGIYFSVRNNRDNGTIIDFVQNRQPYNLGEVRKELRPWLEGYSSYSAEPIPKPEPIAVDRQEILERLSRMKEATSHSYLESRGISKETLNSDCFAGTVYIDNRGSAIFPHQDRDGITGFEGRNHDVKAFSRGGQKSIWRSNFYTSDRRLVVVESPIDALSYHQLYQEPDTRYIATGGSVGERQLEFIKSVFEKAASRGMEIEIATDKDEAGQKLYEQLKEQVPNDAEVSRVTPKHHKDWNELLQAELEQQRQQKKQKQRGRGFSL